RAQGNVQDRAVFGNVDLVTAEHRVDASAQISLLGQSAQERERLVRDPVLRVVEEDAGPLRGQPLAACGVVREQGPQMYLPDFLLVSVQCLPREACGQRRPCHRSFLSDQLALSKAAVLEAITSISSIHEATKDLAPSSWSVVARASTSTPAAANRASTFSLSPPSAVRIPPDDP